jgi:hypothetical protein
MTLGSMSRAEPVDGKEELPHAAERELPPAASAANDARLLDQLARNCGAAPRLVEIRERVLEMDRPQHPRLVGAEPIVEAECVQIRRRTDLENDVACAACVRRSGRDQIELMLPSLVSL